MKLKINLEFWFKPCTMIMPVIILLIFLKKIKTSHAILHQTSYAYIPQQNGMVECKSKLVESTRTNLIHYKIP